MRLTALAGALVVALSAPVARADSAPVATSPPSISGVAQQGQTLTASSGSWSGTTPIAYAYQWERCDNSGSACSAVGGATSQTYAPGSQDAGHTLRVVVTATNSTGSDQAASDATAVVTALSPPAGTAPPQLSGTARLGQQLTVTSGSWSGTPAPTYAYRWQRCDSAGASCADIPGATAQSYTVVAADVGGRLQAVVTASNSAGTAFQTSSQTAVVTSPPANTSPPTIGGTLLVGQTLTAAAGSWSGTPAPAFGYQWRRCDSAGKNCAGIAGATGPAYALTAADASRLLDVVVTATNSEGSASAGSARTGAVAPLVAPSNTAHPTISTPRVVGQSLTANPGSWRGTPPISFAYQWQSCFYDRTRCSNIQGATSQTYTPSPGDFNHRLLVVVTASNGVGQSARLSGQSSQIQSGPLSTSQPPLFGAARADQTLYLGTGSWQGTDPITFSYQWQRCGATGGDCQDIPGATNVSYRPGGDDVGRPLRAVVTAKNPLGSVAQPTPLSAPVAANPIAPRWTSGPAILGTPLVGNLLQAEGGVLTGAPAPTLSYQWQRCATTGDGCFDIPGARGPGYRVRTGDAGHPLRVVVTAANSLGTATVSSAAAPSAVAPSVQRVEAGRRVLRLQPGEARIRLVLFELRGERAVSLWLELDASQNDGWRRLAVARVAYGLRQGTKLLSFDVRPAAGSARISIRWRESTGAVREFSYLAGATSLRAA